MIPKPVTLKSNLYTDLGFDSLSFVCLLLELEQIYSITFSTAETGICLEVGKLIALVEKKKKKSGKENSKKPVGKLKKFT